MFHVKQAPGVRQRRPGVFHVKQVDGEVPSESPSKVTDVPSRCHCARDTSGVGRLLIKIAVGPSTVTVPDSLEDWPYPSTMAV